MRIRPLDFDRDEEVVVAASFSKLTLLETLPEARRDPELVPNGSVAEMAAMYRRGRENPDHRYLVAEAGDGMLVGHAIALMRTDEDGLRYGYGYTRCVLPSHRRRGLARRLLRTAKAWWAEQGADHVMAHTHATNRALQALFTSEGFVVLGTGEGRWPSVVLRCPGAALG